MQDKDTVQKIEEAMEQAEAQLVTKGAPFTAYSLGILAAAILAREDPAEWAAICLATGLNFYIGLVQRRVNRAVAAPVDTRQGMLAFPDYARIPQLIETESGFIDLSESTLEQYDNSTAALAARIRSYNYARRSEAKLKRDKEQLAQRLKLRKNVATFFAGDPEMRMGRAMQLYLEGMETPHAKHDRKIAKRAIKARWDRKKG